MNQKSNLTREAKQLIIDELERSRDVAYATCHSNKSQLTSLCEKQRLLKQKRKAITLLLRETRIIFDMPYEKQNG